MSYCVYKLIDIDSKIYYGSTTNPTIRLKNHRNRSGSPTSSWKMKRPFIMKIIEEGIPYLHIAVIREGYYIRNFDCINKRNPDRWWSLLRRKQVVNDYYIKNKERKLMNEKQKYQENRDKILERAKSKYIKKPRKLSKRSWGGDERYCNNLLLIDPDIFK